MAKRSVKAGSNEPARAAKKPPQKLYKIGEVMQYSGLSRQTIHNYTVLGLITQAERTPSGHRLYDESVFERIAKIERLKRHRTLQEVKALMDELDAAAGGAPDSLANGKER